MNRRVLASCISFCLPVLKEQLLTFRKAPLAILELLGPRAHIIAACVAQNIIHGVGLINISPILAYNEREFSFVIACAVLSDLWDVDLGWKRPIDRSSRLDKKNRNLWDRHICLSGMVSVVEAQAPNNGYFRHFDG